MNAKALKTVFYKNKDYFLNLVKQDQVLKDDHKRLLTESLLYFAVLAAGDDRPSKLKAIEELTLFQNTIYDTIDPVSIGNFASVWSKAGNYHFKFTDRDTAMRMNVTRVTMKNWGFVWASFYGNFIKKESNIPFNVMMFKSDLESMARNSGEWV